MSTVRKSTAALGMRPKYSDDHEEELQDRGIQDQNKPYTYKEKPESFLSFENSHNHDEDDDLNLIKH
jgi:hypothetical protein